MARLFVTTQRRRLQITLSACLIVLCCMTGVSLAGTPASTPTEATFTVQ